MTVNSTDTTDWKGRGAHVQWTANVVRIQLTCCDSLQSYLHNLIKLILPNERLLLCLWVGVCALVCNGSVCRYTLTHSIYYVIR